MAVALWAPDASTRPNPASAPPAAWLPVHVYGATPPTLQSERARSLVSWAVWAARHSSVTAADPPVDQPYSLAMIGAFIEPRYHSPQRRRTTSAIAAASVVAYGCRATASSWPRRSGRCASIASTNLGGSCPPGLRPPTMTW